MSKHRKKKDHTNQSPTFNANNPVSVARAVIFERKSLAPSTEDIYRVFRTKEVGKTLMLYQFKPYSLIGIADSIAVQATCGIDSGNALRMAMVFQNKNVHKLLAKVEGSVLMTKKIISKVRETVIAQPTISDYELTKNTTTFHRMLSEFD